MFNDGYNTCSYLVLKKKAFSRFTLFKYPKTNITMQTNFKFFNKSYVYNSYINVFLKKSYLGLKARHFAVGNLNDVVHSIVYISGKVVFKSIFYITCISMI